MGAGASSGDKPAGPADTKKAKKKESLARSLGEKSGSLRGMDLHMDMDKSMRDLFESIDDAEELITKYHPLNSFGCVMTITLHHHTKEAFLGRKQVQMRDNLRWPQFLTWVQVKLWGLERSNATELRFEYFDELGRPTEIDNFKSYSRWLDIMWVRHPMELHVYEKGSQPMRSPEQDREELAKSLFRMYDVDGSGTINVQEQFMAKELSCVYDADPELISRFLMKAFHAADKDGDQEITFTEFMESNKHVSTAMMSGFFRGSGYRQKAARASALASTSWRNRLGTVANAPPRSVSDVTSGRGNKLLLDANPSADHGVEVRIPKSCFTKDGIENTETANKWIQVSTVSEGFVDQFADPSDRIGQLMSPVVSVELEPGTELLGPIELTLPHCFHEISVEGDPIVKTDVVVAFSTIADASWQILPTSAYELTHPPQDAPKPQLPGDEVPIEKLFPTIKVKVSQGGFIGVFSDNSYTVAQRVIAVAYMPHSIIPLETDTLRVYLLPDLPHAVQTASYDEVMDRGLVVAAGCSRSLRLIVNNSHVRISITPRGANLKSEKSAASFLSEREVIWEGTSTPVDFTFDPECWFPDGFVGDPSKDEKVFNDIQLHHWNMLGRRKRPAISDSQRAVKDGSEPASLWQFHTAALVHIFPSPSAPKNVVVISRTLTAITATWEPPDYWGGCALNSYELQIRLVTGEGVVKEWETARTVMAHETKASVQMQIYACDLRVRATNVGTITPGEWSEVTRLEHEALEQELELQRSRAAYEKNLAEQNQARREKKKSVVKTVEDPGKVSSEDGVATVNYLDEDKNGPERGYGSKWDAVTSMAGWSAFSKVIGEFFLLAGVDGGVRGTLFELKAQQVEKLYSSSGKGLQAVDANEPLVALANCGIWVMETLAHHTENPTDWIELINKIDGLIRLAAFHAIGELADVPYVQDEVGTLAMQLKSSGGGTNSISTTSQMTSILLVLVKLFESMRQCMTGGYIISQLQHKYSAATRNNLRREWGEYHAELVGEVSEQVMSIVEHGTSLSLGVPSEAEMQMLSQMLEIDLEADPGCVGSAMAYQLGVYRARSEARISNPMVTITKMQCALPPSKGMMKLCKGGTALKVSCGDRHDTTLTSIHMTEPRWAMERLQLPLAQELPMTIDVALLGAESPGTEPSTVLGTATLIMNEHVGRFAAPLLDASGAPSGANVAIYYQAPRPA